MSVFLKVLRWLPILAFTIYGVRSVSMQVNLSALLPPELKETRAVQLLLDHATQVDEAMLLLEGPDAKTVEQAANTLTAALRTRPDLVAGVLDRPPLPQMETLDPEKPVEGDTAVWAEMFARAWASRPPAEVTALRDRLQPQALQPGAQLR